MTLSGAGALLLCSCQSARVKSACQRTEAQGSADGPRAQVTCVWPRCSAMQRVNPVEEAWVGSLNRTEAILLGMAGRAVIHLYNHDGNMTLLSYMEA